MSAVNLPSKSTSFSAAKSASFHPLEGAALAQKRLVLRAGRRGTDIHHIAVAGACMPVLDAMNDVGMPPTVSPGSTTGIGT